MPIVGMLMTQSTTTYGMTSRNVPMYLFKPMVSSLIPRRVAWKDADRTRNYWVVIEPTAEVAAIPRGELVRVIGPAGDWTVERDALLWNTQPTKWPKQLPVITFPTQRPLLDMPTVHIDPPGCLDIDDAISILGDEVAITIANVGAWVLANPWMRNAELMGQTLYCGGRAERPMFPRDLSECLMSLLPGERRGGVSLRFRWDGETISDCRLDTVDIIVHGSYTYDTAHEIREFPVETLRSLVEYLEGEPTDDPHRWVESLMVFYNIQVAEILKAKGHGVLRAQEAPDRDKLDRYTQVVPEAVQLAHVAARYIPASEPAEHFGMNAVYTHATSPIRRWADVVNQCVLLGSPLDFDLIYMNQRSREIRKYNRDLFFLDALEFPVQPLEGIILELREDKSKMWVPHWKRVLSIPDTAHAVGERVQFRYHLNMNAPTWKRRMVIEIVP